MLNQVLLAKKIIRIAKEKNISLTELARTINYSPKALKSTLYKMEKQNQEQSLNFDCFVAITEALDIRLDQLM